MKRWENDGKMMGKRWENDVNGLVLFGKILIGNSWVFAMKIMGFSGFNVPLNQSFLKNDTSTVWGVLILIHKYP